MCRRYSCQNGYAILAQVSPIWLFCVEKSALFLLWHYDSGGGAIRSTPPGFVQSTFMIEGWESLLPPLPDTVAGGLAMPVPTSEDG